MSAATTTQVCLFVLLLCPILWTLYTRICHPLARVPGPFLASTSQLWYAGMYSTGRWLEIIEALHKKYGPVVRIAPDEVSISSAAAVDAIYRVRSPFHKTDMYTAWASKAFDTTRDELFSETDERIATEYRRSISHVYSLSSILAFESKIDNQVAQFQQVLQTVAASEELVDAGKLFEHYSSDVLSAVWFGSPFGNLAAGKDLSGIDLAMNGFIPFISKLQLLPRSLRAVYAIASMITSKSLRRTVIAMKVHLTDAAKAMVTRRWEERSLPSTKESGESLLDRFLDMLEQTRGDIGLADIQQEASVALAVGSDTTSISLNVVLAQLLRHPVAMGQLREELEAASLSRLPRYSDLVKLPYLAACIKESLRLSTVVVGQMPRVIPAGDFECCGHRLQSGVAVGVWIDGIHRDQAIFGADAHHFNPQRWIDGDSHLMDRYMLAFGKGTRVCPGRHLAMAGMVKLLACVLLSFEFVQVHAERYVDGNGMWFNKRSNLVVKVRQI